MSAPGRYSDWFPTLCVALSIMLQACGPSASRQDSGGPSPRSSASGLATPARAAERMYAAWRANDRNAAHDAASPQAVDRLFSVPFRGQVGSPNCLTTGSTDTCVFHTQGIVMVVRRTPSGGYLVGSVRFLGD